MQFCYNKSCILFKTRKEKVGLMVLGRRVCFNSLEQMHHVTSQGERVPQSMEIQHIQANNKGDKL